MFDVVAARAGARAARDTVAVLLGRAIAPRVVALRPMAVDFVAAARVVRVADTVPWVAERGVVVVGRVVTLPLRADVAVVALRVVFVCVDADDVLRFMLDASRTAALATPMPTAAATTKINNFLIFMTYIISKRI